MEENYIPRPTDTSAVELPADLENLVERMACNVHDVWAAGRMAEGWSYGPQRDDTAKRHPCLVSYDELPESEKEYDRHTAVETLKFILASGFRIERG